MSKIFIVANWKMNPPTAEEVKRLLPVINRIVKPPKAAVEVVLCPPFIYLSDLRFKIKDLRIGAQDCFWEQRGAYTGEISPFMLKHVGCEYVIIGHSERRHYLGETDAMINKKVKAVLAAKMRPILCVGESAEERKRSLTYRVIQKQLKAGFREIQKQALKKIIVAYEPVWAIGTGNACSFEEARGAMAFIRKIVKNMGGAKIAKGMAILYGGSVHSENARGYLTEAGFQGLLVGGASLNPQEFSKIIDIIQ